MGPKALLAIEIGSLPWRSRAGGKRASLRLRPFGAVDLRQGHSIGVDPDYIHLERRPAMDETMRGNIVELLNGHRLMTVATNRPDGWPQATTVGYVNDGMTIYFLCGPESQKAQNLARDNRSEERRVGKECRSRGAPYD